MKSLALLLLVTACGAQRSDGTFSASERTLAQAELDGMTERLNKMRQQLAALEATNDALAEELRGAQASLDAAQSLLSGDDKAALAQIEAARDALEAIETAVGGSVTLNVPFVFNGEALELGAPYTAAGTTVRYSEVRYWLSDVTLAKASGDFTVPNSYYLMEVRGAQPAEWRDGLTLPANRRETVVIQGVPPGDYTALRFNVGVDAEHNDNLSLRGGELHALDNMAAMTWMWFTSYIFTKTKGTFGPSETKFAWENGSNASLRGVELTFPAQVRIAYQSPATIDLKANLAKAHASLSVSTYPMIDGMNNATQRPALADAFVSMFELVGAHQ